MTREEALHIAEQIKDYLCAGNPIWDVDLIAQTMDMAIKALSDAPDTNVGKWLIAEQDKYMVHSVRCSVCGYCISWMANYCPNCGAKMEVE